MTGKIVVYASVFTAVVFAYFGWKVTARGSYETAEYTVLDSDGPFEIREYPDLTLATTLTQSGRRGNDGSFMRLFRYISGANDAEKKIAMTTPVFMEAGVSDFRGQMGFVVPRKAVEEGIPEPANGDVKIQKRTGGRFAVVRFAGRSSGESLAKNEDKLRNWMRDKGLTGCGKAEFAGYDPPWTPGPLRRNEILIRLK
jgi:hypothetical protein